MITKPTPHVHAVMSQRIEPLDSLDDYPTPRWAVRALCEKILLKSPQQKVLDAWEPACGRGHMAETLKEYFETVYSTDIHDYGYGGVQDFLIPHNPRHPKVAWIVTNPPFRLAEKFIQQAYRHARRGVAMLVRTSFLESIGRYENIFKNNPPSEVAQFVERVPMVRGRYDPKAVTATSYMWIIWDKLHDVPAINTQLVWIPPCRKLYERATDSDLPVRKDKEP
jgi:hypothetical protein